MHNLPAEKNRRILIIDDNRAIHDDFRKILSPSPAATALEASETELFGAPVNAIHKIRYEIDSAYQGQEGMIMVEKALAEGRPYALAFVDIRMPPGWDGLETTRKIWAADPEIQIVLCTAYADYSWDEMHEKIGISDRLVILKKPFDTVEAVQLAHAFTEKWWLQRQSREKMDEMEKMVAERTSELQWKTAFLEAQVSSSIDGILVVDERGKKILQNQRLAELFKIPGHVVDDKADAQQLQWVTAMTKNPGQFFEKVSHLNAHPDEISREEIELKDGTTLDRYSSPVNGQDGKYYGRIWTFRDITERKQTEESLRLLGSAVEQSKESIAITDAELDLPGPRIIFVNPAFTQMTGYTAEEVIGKTPRILQGPRTDKTVLHRLRQNLRLGETFEGETVNYRKDGKEFDLEWQIAPLRDAGGKTTHFVSIQRDITARKQLEARLFQSQKMETVGKLAGGVAHEFNSILTAIIGQSELLLGDLPGGSPLAKSAVEISKAAARAATLTRQLLAFGRKQILQPEILDLNRVVAGMEGMLHHLLGSEVGVQIVLASGLQTVLVDAGQIEQVIMNMVINARDAMPNGGKLTLETANISFDPESVGRYPELTPGGYVMLAISDTGTGMSPEVKTRVFEPFFTTKGIGQGTGLGLSTCYGIIKQSGGHISVYSELARGSTFKIYLPEVESQITTPVLKIDSPDLPPGTETILLVEDDPALREMAATLLRRLGYTVFSAANGIEALSLKQQRDIGHIDLLFTDVVMPHMSGKELADRVRALYPHTRILFTSAYTENAIVHQGVLDKGVSLLQKPFTPSALAHKVRELLDKRTP